jgi:hypothetical protein
VSTETKPASGKGDDEPVPKLPRGRGLKFSGPELFRIALTIVALIGVIVLTRPCANAVSGFVTSFDSDTKKMPKPGNVDVPKEPQHYEELKPGMSEAEIKAAMERARAHASGSTTPNAGGNAPSGGSNAPSAGSNASTGSASSDHSTGSNAPATPKP